MDSLSLEQEAWEASELPPPEEPPLDADWEARCIRLHRSLEARCTLLDQLDYCRQLWTEAWGDRADAIARLDS